MGLRGHQFLKKFPRLSENSDHRCGCFLRLHRILTPKLNLNRYNRQIPHQRADNHNHIAHVFPTKGSRNPGDYFYSNALSERDSCPSVYVPRRHKNFFASPRECSAALNLMYTENKNYTKIGRCYHSIITSSLIYLSIISQRNCKRCIISLCCQYVALWRSRVT